MVQQRAGEQRVDLLVEAARESESTADFLVLPPLFSRQTLKLACSGSYAKSAVNL